MTAGVWKGSRLAAWLLGMRMVRCIEMPRQLDETSARFMELMLARDRIVGCLGVGACSVTSFHACMPAGLLQPDALNMRLLRGVSTGVLRVPVLIS